MRSVGRFQDSVLLQHWQSPVETGIKFGRQGHEMNCRRGGQGDQTGKNGYETQSRDVGEHADEG